MKKFSILILLLAIFWKVSSANSPGWTHVINAQPDTATKFAVKTITDSEGFIYTLTTYYKSDTNGVLTNKICVNKFDHDGGELFNFVYDHNGMDEPRGYDIATDTKGDVYIAGALMGSPGWKPFIIKIHADGTIAWSHPGAVNFTTGRYDQLIIFNNSLYLRATEGVSVFDTAGVEKWSLAMNPLAMAVNSRGEMIVSSQPAPLNTLFVYDSTGVNLFSRQTAIIPQRIATDAMNNIILLSAYGPYGLTKYDGSGTFLWTKNSFPQAPPFTDLGFDVLIDHSNNIIAVGLNDTMFKYDPAGNLLWEKPMNGLDAYIISAHIISSDFIAVAGSLLLPLASMDLKVSLFDSTGAEAWTETYNSNSTEEYTVDMAVRNSSLYILEDSLGDSDLLKYEPVVFSGGVDYNLICVDSVWYDTIPGHVNISIYNGSLGFLNYPSVQIFNAAGDTITDADVYYFGQGGNSYAVYPQQIYVQGITDFSNYTFTINENFSDTSGIIHFCFPTRISETASEDLIIYPDPATDYLQLNYPQKKLLIISVYDFSGRLIQQHNLESESSQINISSLIPGIYFLNISTDKNSFTRKFIKIN